VVQEVARELAGKGAVVQVNTDENPHLAGRFNINGVPALLVLKRGQVVDSRSGALHKQALLTWFTSHCD
jgi:thioredoxin 2